jgi:drug/metabolite transporter (DMT)-like permease
MVTFLQFHTPLMLHFCPTKKMKMKRNILSVILGLLSAIVVFLITENINNSLHPVPGNLNLKDPKALSDFYGSQDLSFWIIVLWGWTAGSLLCGYLIKRISRKQDKTPALIAGSLLTLSALANFFALPHPTWFMVTGILLFIPATLLGHQFYKNKSNE